MSEPQANRKWKWLYWRALCIYAVLCTVLTTAYIALLLWFALFEKPAPLWRGSEEVFMTSYFSYMATEYPQRGGRFKSMAETLCEHVAQTNITEMDLFRYLGRPDQFIVTNVIIGQAGQSSVTNKVALFAYLFDYPGPTNKWAVTALVADGKVEQVSLRDPKRLQSGFRPFLVESVQQGGADGRQPFSPETNETSAAAASGRSH